MPIKCDPTAVNRHRECDESRNAPLAKKNRDSGYDVKHTCILGAGPAGLATGYELSVNHAKVTILEKNSYVGGLCRTVCVDGYRFDLGGHRWFTKNAALNDWFRELMAGELLTVNRTSRIYFNGKYFKYPVQLGDVFKNTGISTIVSAAFQYMIAVIEFGLFKKPVTNIKEAYTKQFGGKLYEMFFKVYTEKVWGRRCEDLSADWVVQRSKGLNILKILQRILIQRNKTISLVDSFMYPRLGYVRIPERMAEEIEKRDNRILLDSAVKKIIYRGPGYFEIQYQVKNSKGAVRTVYADSIVSTIPLGMLANILEPACDETVRRAARSMTFRDLITVNLMLNRAKVSDDTWLYLQEPSLLFGRLHEPKNWSSRMVPDDDHTSLVLEIFCSTGDDIWNLTDDAIAKRCIDDLVDQLRFLNREDVENWAVVRTAHAYPVYDLDYAKNIKVVRQFLNGFKGLHIAGRGGTFRYNNADHSIEMGLKLGRKIIGDSVDHLMVNTEAEYHEENLAES